MALEFRGEEIIRGMRLEVAKRLLAAARHFQKFHMEKIGIVNPPPYLDSSKPGEYLKKRTGWLQSRVLYEPTSPSSVADNDLTIRVGIGESARYGVWHELFNRRLGLEETLKRTKRDMAALVSRGGAVGLAATIG